MSFEKLESFTPTDGAPVKITEMGWITEVMFMSSVNSEARIRKIDADHYVDLATGEVKEFQHFENRASSVNSLRQTFRRLRNTVNANIIDTENVRFITLTYRQDNGEPMTDPKRLYRDFEVFNKRFKRYCQSESYGEHEYINVVEPQGSGAWHCHVLYFFDRTAPYLPNELIREMWGQGWVTVRSLKTQFGKNVDNIGAYLTAYLGDLDVESAIKERMDITKFEVKEIEVSDNGEQKKKYFLKGARLFLYPTGMNIIRCSRGVKRPIESEDTYKNAKRKMSGSTLTFQSHIKFKVEDFESIISKRYYNTKKQGSQAIIEGYRVDIESGEILESVFRPHREDE